MSTALSLKHFLQEGHNTLTNYKGSGLQKFQKFAPRIFPSHPHKFNPIIVETENDLCHIIHTKYNHPINLIDIIKLYCEHNIQLTNNVIIQLPTNEINNVREYTRDKHIYSSKKTPEQYNQLMEDIKQNGFNECSRIRLTKNAHSQVEVLLVEGNHRLSIAKHLKLSTMPIRLVYTA